MRILLALGLFGAGCVAVLVTFLVLVRVISNDEPTDCSAVELPDAREWRLTDLPDRISLAGDLSACSAYDDLTSAQVTEAFGPPDGGGTTSEGLTAMVFVFDPEDDPGDAEELRLYLDDDHVVDVELISSTGP